MTHRPKKSLGQHFLKSASALRAIVSSGKVTSSDTVLEIGPGEGVLTAEILATGATVVAVEKDRDLIPLLTEKFADAITQGRLTLIEADVLDFNPTDHGLTGGTYKLIANIPYYITGAIFEKFLTEMNPPLLMVVLIQKEVATRIVARDNKESILSISVKAFGKPKITGKVPRSAFKPAPDVDSAIILVEKISRARFTEENLSIKSFFDVVRAGFAHKRKLLIRNLEAVSTKDTITRAFTELSLDPKVRAEDILPDTWFTLARALAGK